MPVSPPPSSPFASSSRARQALYALVGLTVLYLIIAYVILPFAWKRYARRHPALDDVPGITLTASGIPGDPLNVALVGSKADVMKIMVAARWYPADPLTLKSCLEIAEATVLKRPYDAAPVSSLYLFGRKEDLAFEQPVGDNPRERHHVRFWQCAKTDEGGRPLWIGSAVFDQHVGLSRTTGQVTHVTAADVDAERDFLFADLMKTGDLLKKEVIADFHRVCEGKNGGGDPWRTDGDLFVGTIK